MRATVSLPMPKYSAKVRVDHCVEPSGGVVVLVSRTTSATVPSGSHDVRPRPLAMVPTPATPWSSKRRRQRRTASASTSQRRAISSLAMPSAAHSNALAWRTLRWGNDIERAMRSSSLRSPRDTANASAVITGMLTP
jgi:hypothetical protein